MNTHRDGVCVGLTMLGEQSELMLVVRTKRFPDMWQPIGGGVNEHEGWREAAIREVQEETGWYLAYDDLREVARFPMDAHNGTLLFFLAKCPEGNPMMDDEEIVSALWVTKTEAVLLEAFPAARQFFHSWASGQFS